jgi:prepilin-type N-terminal cleavage/methylation domain-containing protein
VSNQKTPSLRFGIYFANEISMNEPDGSQISQRRKATKEAVKMRSNQKGFSLIELLIVVAIILIIAAIAIPNLLRSKMAANEASAVASLRTYNTAIAAYQTTYATDPTTDFSQLGPVSGGSPSASSADLVDNLLGAAGNPVKSGYSFTYTPVSATPVTQYTILAVPSSSSTGQRQFFTDQSGVIRQTTDGTTPTVASTPIG